MAVLTRFRIYRFCFRRGANLVNHNRVRSASVIHFSRHVHLLPGKWQHFRILPHCRRSIRDRPVHRAIRRQDHQRRSGRRARLRARFADRFLQILCKRARRIQYIALNRHRLLLRLRQYSNHTQNPQGRHNCRDFQFHRTSPLKLACFACRETTHASPCKQ
jgi:hypothetical protein